MTLNYYKNETERVCKSKGWDRAPIDTVWLLLSEEVGELASAIRQYKKMYKKTNLKREKRWADLEKYSMLKKSWTNVNRTG